MFLVSKLVRHKTISPPSPCYSTSYQFTAVEELVETVIEKFWHDLFFQHPLPPAPPHCTPPGHWGSVQWGPVLEFVVKVMQRNQLYFHSGFYPSGDYGGWSVVDRSNNSVPFTSSLFNGTLLITPPSSPPVVYIAAPGKFLGTLHRSYRQRLEIKVCTAFW